jgi:DHA2 family multidrug resistance protein
LLLHAGLSVSVDVDAIPPPWLVRLDRTTGRLFGTAPAGEGNGEGEPSRPSAHPGQPCRHHSFDHAGDVHGVDTTITNVALPHMQGGYPSQDGIAWVVTSYIVAAAIMTLTGWLAGRFGIKYVSHFGDRLHRGAGCAARRDALAGDLPVAARRLRHGLVPLSQAVLFQINPPERHAQAMAVGHGVILGPIIGPALNSYLTDYCNWRWVFFINLPFGSCPSASSFSFTKRATPIASRSTFGFAALSIAIGVADAARPQRTGIGSAPLKSGSRRRSPRSAFICLSSTPRPRPTARF